METGKAGVDGREQVQELVWGVLSLDGWRREENWDPGFQRWIQGLFPRQQNGWKGRQGLESRSVKVGEERKV